MKDSAILGKFTIFQTTGKESQLEELSLYDTLDLMPIKIFFQILKTENLELINRSNQKVEKPILQKVWNRLLDEYYQKTNKRQYQQIISTEKQKWILRNKITTCSVALMLYDVESSKNEVLNALEYFGFKDKNKQYIESSLLRDKSSLNLLESKSKINGKKEDINFWKLLANVENALNRQLDVDKISVSYWIELVTSIKERNSIYGKKGRRNKKV